VIHRINFHRGSALLSLFVCVCVCVCVCVLPPCFYLSFQVHIYLCEFDKLISDHIVSKDPSIVSAFQEKVKRERFQLHNIL
jgi:hypothetical protein